MVKSPLRLGSLLILILILILVLAAALLFMAARGLSLGQDPLGLYPIVSPDGKTFTMGSRDSFYPWTGSFQPDPFTTQPGAAWGVDFDISVNMDRLKDFPGVVEALVVVLVGEQIFDDVGKPTGLSAISISSSYTAAGIPLSHYEGTLPVRALGNRRGSPLEAIKEFPAAAWASGGEARLKGRLEAKLPTDLRHGFYRPHLDLFVRIKGSNTPVSLAHLPYQLGQWLEDNLNLAGPAGLWAHTFKRWVKTPMEFMHDPQLLPNIKVGQPARPKMPWMVFQDVASFGRSGLLPREDEGRVALLNRVRYPTPFQLLPRNVKMTPGLPTLFPEEALASLFIGEDTVPPMISNYMDFNRGHAEASVTGPDGATRPLGKLRFVGKGRSGPLLERGGFDVDLTRMGSYTLKLSGSMYDLQGRAYDAGGTYAFTVALPLSFSTPVKPGTNFLAGARFPASAHVNPPLPAEVTVEIWYYPGSDRAREKHVVFSGKANRFGHFTPARPPLLMDEPGEYRSLVMARYTDLQGRLWQGAQTSAGVVADRDPQLVLHGGRTYISPPNPKKEHYGGWARYQLDFEGASSYLADELLSQFDNTFPYHSGDTLHVATTYPFESVVGIVLSMEAKSEALARRIVEAYNPSGKPYNYPMAPRWRELVHLPDVFKFGEDNFGYHRVSVKHRDHLPILSANREGLSPQLHPEQNELEAYTYLSVIRPGFPVMSLAFSGSFMGPCWIVSPNEYGGQINASPNGDLPGDLYRVMAGLVVKDRASGKNYYDSYVATIVASAPGTHGNAVTAPGERPVTRINGRDFPFFLGMDTSDVFMVGEQMMLGGGVMPSVGAKVSLRVTKPDGSVELLSGSANKLGGAAPPRPVMVDQPGVYRVKVEVEHGGKKGDVVGSGDGEFFHFAIPPDTPQLLDVGLPAASAVEYGEKIPIPLSWPRTLTKARITYSLMMPGAVLDEGTRQVAGHRTVFEVDPGRLARQYPFIDTRDHATGEKIYADTIIATILLEAEQGSEKVYDAVRIILRGPMLYNARALTKPGSAPASRPGGHPAPAMPGKRHGKPRRGHSGGGHPPWIPR